MAIRVVGNDQYTYIDDFRFTERVVGVLASGTCGSGVTWTLKENGEKAYLKNGNSYSSIPGATLTISGSGAMTSGCDTDEPITFDFSGKIYSVSSVTTAVIVEEGVTSLPSSVFQVFPTLRRISLPSTLTTIGVTAFRDCDALKSILILTQIGSSAFQSCDSLRSVTIGSGVKEIPSLCFKDCVRLMTLRLKRYMPSDWRNPITTYSGNINSADQFSFAECKSLASIVVPEAGMKSYQTYGSWGKPFYQTQLDNNSKSDVYFGILFRSDQETLFPQGATNEWIAWVDNSRHAAPRGAEVYTVGSIEGGVVKLNRLTATVTLPEDERTGAGDDGVRALIPAFTPVLIKRPSGTVTEDLKMTSFMGGELAPENGWLEHQTSATYTLWSESGVTFDTDAELAAAAGMDITDPMAHVPYGYRDISYTTISEAGTPAGTGDFVNAYDNGGTFRLYGNVDKSNTEQTQPEPESYTAFVLDGDRFRRVYSCSGFAPHEYVLIFDYDGTSMPLSTSDRALLTLSDNTDNTGVLSSYAGGTTVDVQLSGRTLYKDGDWNTLCLPFGGAVEGTPLAGATVMGLDAASSGLADGVLTLSFTDANTLEAGKPYIVKWDKPVADLVIRSVADWDAFAANVSNGVDSYAGKLVRLGADIDGVTTMVGLEEDYPFEGYFDGDGHTLTVNLNSTEKYCAPFRFVQGARFRNLRVAGTVTSSASYAAGVIACVLDGTVTLDNCESGVTIVYNEQGGYAYHGGFIGEAAAGRTTINNCLFSGSFTHESDYDLQNYGFVANIAYGIVFAFVHLNNCLFAPSATPSTPMMDRLFLFDSGGLKFPQNITTNCYYTTLCGGNENIEGYTNYAIQALATTDELVSRLGDGWEISGQTVVPKMGIANLDNAVFQNVAITSPAPSSVPFTGGQFVGSYNTCRANLVLRPLGNVNGDGEVDDADLTVLTDYLVGKPAAASYPDVNGDTKVDITDVTTLIGILTSGQPALRVVSNVEGIGLDSLDGTR